MEGPVEDQPGNSLIPENTADAPENEGEATENIAGEPEENAVTEPEENADKEPEENADTEPEENADKEPEENIVSEPEETAATVPENAGEAPPEIKLPEKEVLHFPLTFENLDPDEVELVKSVREVAEKKLYRWKSFPIVLPPRFENSASLNVSDLFVEPDVPVNELDALAVDSTGRPRKLNEIHLETIRRCGEFEVPSIKDPELKHRWLLNRILQKGYERAKETFLDNTAFAFALVLVHAARRIRSKYFSILQGLRYFKTGLLRLLDILIGIPHHTYENEIEEIVREERARYLVAELDCTDEIQKALLHGVAEYILEKIPESPSGSYDNIRLKPEEIPPRLPYLFEKPDEPVKVDVRLYNKNLIQKVMPTLKRILEKQLEGWFPDFREEVLKRLTNDPEADKSVEEIQREANLAVEDEYLKRVFAALNEEVSIKNIGKGLTRLLIDVARYCIKQKRILQDIYDAAREEQLAEEGKMKKENPLMSRISDWAEDYMAEKEATIAEDCHWKVYDDLIDFCDEEIRRYSAGGSDETTLQQYGYFLKRDLVFVRDIEPEIRRKYQVVVGPKRVFNWVIHILNPSNWKVWRNYRGKSERIPTVFNSTLPAGHMLGGNRQPSYSIQRTISRKSNTSWPFWRWWNFFHRTQTILVNSFYFFALVIPWASCVGFRAVFSPTSFYPDWVVSQDDGTLYLKESSKTHSIVSRLEALWQHIRESREKFENEPDRGFIGKPIARQFHRLWNYVVKGVVGTFIVVTVFPIVCLSISCFSTVAGVTAILWAPAVSMCSQLFMILIYDMESPSKETNSVLVIFEAVVWDILILGLLQTTVAAAYVVLSPVLSLAVLTFSVVRYGIRSAWDRVMFYSIIKKHGRIPYTDGFFVKRIGGPGLASSYFYQVKPEHVLAVFAAHIEMDELTAFENEKSSEIDQPINAFKVFAARCFDQFSLEVRYTGVYQSLHAEASALRKKLRDAVHEREKHLYIKTLNIEVRSQIKMLSKDLKICINKASELLEQQYPTRVLKRLPNEAAFWESKKMRARDWTALARSMIAQGFSRNILTPLEDADSVIHLEVKHVDFSTYTDMLMTAEFHDDLEVTTVVHEPRKEVYVNVPHFDVSEFNPRHVNTFEDLTAPQFLRSGKNEVSLPSVVIPTVVYVTVIIFNRSSENRKIDLDSKANRQLINSIDEKADTSHPHGKDLSL